MTLKKISTNQLLENMASISISLRMNEIEIEGREFLSEKLGNFVDAVKPEKSATIATLIFNAYVWGQEYQKSLASDSKRIFVSKVGELENE